MGDKRWVNLYWDIGLIKEKSISAKDVLFFGSQYSTEERAKENIINNIYVAYIDTVMIPEEIEI